LFGHIELATIGGMETAPKKKRPRAKRGEVINCRDPVWTRRGLYLGSDGRAYAYAGDAKYREIPEEEFLEHFDRVVGRWDPDSGIPGYTSLYAESDGLDAR
jgi:hypothetical protein